MVKKIAQLLLEIEKLRGEMHRVAAEKGFRHEEVLQISQQLDSLLNQYYKITKDSSAYPPIYNTKMFYPFKFKEHAVVTFCSGIYSYFCRQCADACLCLGTRLSALLLRSQAFTAEQNSAVT